MSYYLHTCKCGCGGQIEIKKHHKYHGVPSYINGHCKFTYKLEHAETNTRLYSIWSAIKQRVLNPNKHAYKDYGGRGITICPKWTNDYIAFRDWALSNDYQEGLEIDRRNNNGNYEPSNCRWITHKENMRNKRGVKLTLEIANEIRDLYNTGNYTQRELAIKFNVKESNICQIINNKKWKDNSNE